MNENWFETQRDKFQDLSKVLHKQSRSYALLRTLSFVLLLVTAFTSIYFRMMDVLILGSLFWVVVFAVLVKRHNKLLHQKKLNDILVSLNEHELQRLEMNLSQLTPGTSYDHVEHENSIDLDLFGPHSLFQLLNRTVTPGGQDLLSSAILEPASNEEILRRQGASQELSKIPQWVMSFLAAGKAHDAVNSSLESFKKWIDQVQKPKVYKWYLPVLLVLPVISLTMVIWYFVGGIPSYYLLPVFLINGYILYQAQPQAQETYQSTHQSIKVLGAYQEMIKLLEQTQFKDPYLIELQSPFMGTGEQASVIINQLRQILNRIETRHNFFYWIFNIIFLLDLIWLMQAAGWKQKHSTKIAKWFNCLSHFELLASIGLSRFANPDWVDPVLSEHPFTLQAQAIGHPLIHPKERQSNNFELQDQGTVVVLTGSNMSGKSTFLRTVGINTVLAYMGAPVCAQSLTLGHMKVFTSMRTTDNLEQHVSSFYAELKRLRQLIQHLEQPVPTLFLLDEILKGTNSEDRHKGAIALIKQLHTLSAFGIVSTHDLALGRLAESHDYIENYSFNSQLKEGALHFDYLLTKGICHSFNASELMAQMGIEMGRWQDP